VPEALFRQQLLFFQRSFTGIDDNVLFKVQHPLEVAKRDIQQVADAAGEALKNQTLRTGGSELDVPMRSRRTLERVTSTPHLSQMTPRCFMRLYLPHKHSQSVTGPKMRRKTGRRAPV